MWLGGEEDRLSIGMDCSWFTTFLQAFFDCAAAAELPIWRVFKGDWEKMQPISDEGEWDTAWAKVKALRESDPANQYHCSTSIEHERE